MKKKKNKKTTTNKSKHIYLNSFPVHEKLCDDIGHSPVHVEVMD